MYKILALDLDGTLLNSQKEITPRTIRAIRAAEEAGYHPVICTGRMVQSARRYWEILDLHTPIIGYNGAYVKRLREEGVIFHKPIPPAVTRAVVDYCREEDLHVQAYMDDVMYVERDNEYSREYGETYGVSYRVVESLDILFPQGSTKLLALTSPERLEGAVNALREACGAGVRAMSSEQTHIEIIDASVSKAAALSVIAEVYGVTMSEVVAIGDGANDVEMIRSAGLGAATENACAAAKAAADRVIPSNDEDGVAVFLFDLLLNGE